MVATPIGNLEDLAPRARRILGSVALIAAEDTRHSGQLLARLGLSVPLLSLHEHNEDARVPGLVERLHQGEEIALVSDAGTPLLSDPGFRLVRACREAGLQVLPVPGPSAALAALSVAGLPSDRFLFEGFLPASAPARRERLGTLLANPITTICFESAHRIASCATDLAALDAQREIFLAREMTKQFEQHFFGAAALLPEWLAADANRTRGEFVLAIGPKRSSHDAADAEFDEGVERLLGELLRELPLKQAVRLAARVTGAARNRLYARALELTGEDPRD